MSEQQNTYVLLVDAIHRGDGSNERGVFLVLARTKTQIGLHTRIHQLLVQQQWAFVFGHEPHAFEQYLQESPQHRTVLQQLAGQLTEQAPIALARIDEGGKAEQPNSYLSVTEHAIPPLPDQEHLPFWEKEWIPPALEALLFHPNNGEALRTYLVLDANRYTKTRKFYNLDFLDELPTRCLLKGKAAEVPENGSALCD